jgi:transcriptional regulator with XRE-family HTH domain
MLREARRRSGRSQEEVASRVGLHPTNLSKVERGHVTPNALLLLALMRELAIPPTALSLVLRRTLNERRAAQEIELAIIASRLTDEGLELALEQMKSLVSRMGKPRARLGRSSRHQQ